MTKEALKDYLTEAVNAVGEEEVGVLFPTSKEPGLYAVMQELIGLKGAVSKLSGANLKLNQEVNGLVKTVAARQSENTNFPEEAKQKIYSLESALNSALVRLMDMDELMQLTVDSFADLPKLTERNVPAYQRSLNSWKKGFDLTIERWQKMLQANDLKKVGLVGETFSPKLHQAVGVKNWNNIANNIILETEQAGFLHKGKVSRLAKVVVNKLKGTSKTGASKQEVKSMKETPKMVSPKRVAPKPQERPTRVAQSANRNGRVAVIKKEEIEEWGQVSVAETSTGFGETKKVDQEKQQEIKKDKKKQASKKKVALKKKKEKAAAKKYKKEKQVAKKEKRKKQQTKQEKKKRNKKLTNKKKQKKKSKKKEFVTSGKITIQKIEKDSNYLIIVRE